MIGLSAAPIRRQSSSTTRVTGAANIPERISRPGQGFFRPMHMAATVSCMLPVANLALSWRQVASPTRFLDDGRVCLSNNAAERSLRCVPLGRKSWLFCGSDRGGQRAAIAYSLIQTCRLNEVDPQAWLADVLARIADHPVSRLNELLPWNWRTTRLKLAA